MTSGSMFLGSVLFAGRGVWAVCTRFPGPFKVLMKLSEEGYAVQPSPEGQSASLMLYSSALCRPVWAAG